jgi:hypothetical protein
MPRVVIEGAEGEPSPEEAAAAEAVERCLAIYRRSPFPRLRDRDRQDLALACALAALDAAGRGNLDDER